MNVLKIKQLDDRAELPAYATAGAIAFDLKAIHGGIVPAQGAATFGTGLAVEVPPGYGMFVFSRSGHGFKLGVRLANGTGLIDSDYRGEVLVRLTNDSHEEVGVGKGERIAQAVILPTPQWELVWAGDLSETARGAAGIGSTGR